MEIAHGPASCGAALKIEKAYAAALASGHAPGNGGGGPVSVRGWVCSGFDTPEILRTGDVSKCTKGPAEVLAVLPNPAFDRLAVIRAGLYSPGTPGFAENAQRVSWSGYPAAQTWCRRSRCR